MFPSLLDIPGFLLEFITPIIRVCAFYFSVMQAYGSLTCCIYQCRHKRTKEEISFFTIPEYEAWEAENNKSNEWDAKYFKV